MNFTNYEENQHSKPDEKKETPVPIPLDALSSDARNSIINEFILREGTDYGAIEKTHEEKFRDVERQLKNKELLIIFEVHTESVTLISKKEYSQLMSHK